MKSLRTKRVIRKLMPFCHNLSSSSYWLNSSGIFIIRINIRWHSLLRNGKQIASHFGVIVLLRIVPIFYVAVAVLHICVMSSRQKLLKWFMIIKQHYKFLNSLQETIVRLCNMLQTRLHSVVWLSFQKGKKKMDMQTITISYLNLLELHICLNHHNGAYESIWKRKPN